MGASERKKGTRSRSLGAADAFSLALLDRPPTVSSLPRGNAIRELCQVKLDGAD